MESARDNARSNRIRIWDIDGLLYNISRQIRSTARFLFNNSLVKTVCNNARLSKWLGLTNSEVNSNSTTNKPKQNNVYAYGKAITRTDINSNTLAQHILRTLNISDSHAVNSWILKLLAEGMIKEQPKGIYPQKEPSYLIPHSNHFKQFVRTESVHKESLVT